MRTLTLLNPHRRGRRSRFGGFRRFGGFKRGGSRLLRSYGIRRNYDAGSLPAHYAQIPFSPLKTVAKRKAAARKAASTRKARHAAHVRAGKKAAKTRAKNLNKKRKKSSTPKHTMSKKSGKRRRHYMRGGYKVTTYTTKRKGRRRARRMVRLRTRFGSASIRRNPDILGMFKSVVSKDNLQIAGGVIGASVLNKFVIGRFGASLPMASTPLVNTLYQAAIPAVAAVAVRKFAPRVAEGLVLGGLVVAVNGLLQQFLPQAAGFSSYIDQTPPQPILPYPTGGLSPITGSVDSASRINANIGSNTMAYSGIYDSPMPFQSDAWAN